MALSTYVKTKINGILTKHSIDDIYVEDFYIQNKQLYTPTELVSYLIEVYDKKLAILQSNKMIAKIVRAINLIIGRCLSLELEMPNDLYLSLTKLREKYNQHLKNNDLKSDDIIISELDDLDKLLSESKVEESQDSSVEIIDLQNKLSNLENELRSMNDQIKSKDDKYNKAKKELKELKLELKTLKKENSNNAKTVINQEEVIKSLKTKVEELEIQISKQINQSQELNDQISTLRSKNIDLSNQKKSDFQTINSQAQKISKLKEELKEYRNQIEYLNVTNNQKDREYDIDEAILMLILDNDNTIDEFKQSLKSIIGDVSLDEIYSSMKRLQSRYSFATGMDINLKPVYQLSKPDYISNVSINFEVASQIDMIAISDLHMSEFSLEELKKINYIYDYAAANGIKTIINLGDLFDFKSFTSSDRYNDFKKNNDMIDAAIKSMPYDKNIHHLLMGGNHDKLILGVDSIKTLCDERKDFINLGYDHAKLQLGNNSIHLHHINSKFDEPDNSYANKNLLVALKRYYEKAGESRKKSYIDLLGHIHKSSLSLSDSYAIIPSLNIDRFCNGAWHLKIYFDNSKNISNIVFIPLIFNPKVQANTEIVYKKIQK